MTREDVQNMLGENATKEQITEFLNTYQGDVDRQKSLQAQIDQMKAENETLKGYKKQIDEINKAKMTEEEKLKSMQAEAEKNLKESRTIVNTAKAKEILAGLDIGDDLISTLVTDDIDKTVANATNLKNKMSSYKEQVTKEVTDSLLKKDLTPPASNVQSDKGMTWDKFKTLSDEEQATFARENPEAFNNL